MRVVFAGTPAFAVPALEALLARHDVALVLTQPDRPSGRGLKLASSPVAQLAERHGLRLSKPASLRTPESQAELAGVAPDVMVVAAYGLLLPQQVLDIPRRGCINIHASLLPRWRGAAPIQRAILAGDRETGISIMRMEAGLDTGPVLLARSVPIAQEETAGSLTDRLAPLGAEAIVVALERLDSLTPLPQDASGVTYAAKVTKAEALVDWHRPAEEIGRQVRAFNPAPGAEALLGELRLKIWDAEPIPDEHSPGEVCVASGELVVGCGTGSLRLRTVQRSGSRRMSAADFLRGTPALGAAAGTSTN